MGWTNYIPRLTVPGRKGKVTRSGITVERDYVVNPFSSLAGEGVTGFTPTEYGKYYFSNTWVYRAVKLRADSVAAAKLRIMREAEGDLVPVDATHPLQELMDRVNPWWTASDMWRATETYLGIWGGCFWYLDREGESGPELWPLRPDKMKVIRRSGQKDMTSHIAGFEYSGHQGRRIPLTTEEIIWFRYINPLSEMDGASPIAPVRLTVDMGHDAIEFNRNQFKNGVSPNNLAFSVEGVMTDDEYDDFMRRLENRYKGARNAHKPFVITNGADAKTLGLSARDMEYNEGLNFTVEDVSRAYGIWPELLASGTRAAFRNTPEAVADFWMSTVSSEWTFLETEVTEALMPLFGGNSKGLVAQFDPTGIPALERARAAESRLDLEAVKLGAITVNEWRAEQGRDEVPWGDEPLRQSDPFGLEPAPSEDEGQRALPAPKVSNAPALRHFNKGEKLVAEEKTIEQVRQHTYKALDERERSFKSMMSNLFDEQQASVLSRLRANHDIPGSIFFEPSEWERKFEKRGKPMIEDAVVEAARNMARLFRLTPKQVAVEQQRGFNPFDANDPGFVAWVAERVRFWTERTNEETARLVMEEIAAGRRAGEGLSELQRRIENVFGFSDAVRSERIARTENVAATNSGHINLYQTSGVVQMKRWLTSNDERVRASHFEPQRNGPIPLDEKFSVGGDMMDAPGLGSIPSEVINCRCVCLPVIQR